MFEITVNLAI